MTEDYKEVCSCQVYTLKSHLDAKDLLEFFHADRTPKRKKTTKKYVQQFLDPSVTHQKKVGSVEVMLKVYLVFPPKQYLDRASELLTVTKMSKATRLFVQQKKESAEECLKERAKYPPALFFALHFEDTSGSGFSPEVIPKILEVKIIKSNLDFLLKKVYRRSRYGYVCATLQYDASKFKFVGGIVPAPLPVPKLISNKLGEPSLNSITLGFENSPIGLEEVQTEKKNAQLVLTLKIARKVNNFKDLYPKVLNEAIEIAQLLVQRVA